jgi:hypothetical protein
MAVVCPIGLDVFPRLMAMKGGQGEPVWGGALRSLAGGIPINAKTQLRASRVAIWNWVLFSQGRAPGTPSAAPDALRGPWG